MLIPASRGLMISGGGFRRTRIRPKGGLSIRTAEVSIGSDRADAEIHYTINGGEPTLADPVYSGPFRLDRDATVRARAFLGTLAEDDVAVRRFAFGRPAPAPRTGSTEPGLSYEVFEGEWGDLGGIGKAKAVPKETK